MRFMEQSKCEIGVYPLTTENKLALRGFVYSGATYNKRFKLKVFVFNDEHKKINIDLLFVNGGRLYVSEPYGETVNREKILYVLKSMY